MQKQIFRALSTRRKPCIDGAIDHWAALDQSEGSVLNTMTLSIVSQLAVAGVLSRSNRGDA